MKQLIQLKDYRLAQKKPEVSFEFFPTKSDTAAAAQWEAVKALEKLNPRFMTVTFGAGGTTRERTFDLVEAIKTQTICNVAAHLTCVGSTREEIHDIVRGYLDIGVNRIVALRGDMPNMEGNYEPFPGGYAYADDLVAGLVELGVGDISVAAYPETHPQAQSAEADLDHLRRKQDAGATRAITQYCFDTDVILRFIERARAHGIAIPIVPGVLPISNYKQMVSFSERCGASVPNWLRNLFEAVEDNTAMHHDLALLVAMDQCRVLLQEGVEELHFYTLNHADLVVPICHTLGITTAAA